MLFTFGRQQGLQSILGNELIGLQRRGPVAGRRDIGLGLGGAGIGQAQERGLGEVQHHEDIHGRIGPQTSGADLPGEAHAPVDFHGAGVDALRLGQEGGLILLLDDHAGHPAPPQIQRQSEPDGTRANDENLRVHGCVSLHGDLGTRRMRPISFQPCGRSAAIDPDQNPIL
jgi:hypothetical protein